LSQKEIFKYSEGDAWFERNKETLKKRNFDKDPLVAEIRAILNSNLLKNKKINILEVGCGEGSRGQFISEIVDCNFFGIDPSKKAVKAANDKGINAILGSADKLPYEDNQFDIIIYGFCFIFM
jgi:ubiquinone/menaquinone biosynthesis C-methylase UbiE